MYQYALLVRQGGHWMMNDGDTNLKGEWSNPVEALNELSKRHWELVTAFEGSNPGSGAQSGPSFLLRKTTNVNWDMA